MTKAFNIKTLILIFALSIAIGACGKNCSNKSNNTPKTSNAISAYNDIKEKSKTKKGKNNVEVLLDYVKKVDNEKKYWLYHSYSKFMSGLFDIYKNDIVNKYTGGKEIETANRTESYFYHTDTGIDNSISVNIVYLINLEDLKDTDTKEIQYCCCPRSKGGVIGFLFYDGIYLYEIDENGKKINEESYYFKES